MDLEKKSYEGPDPNLNFLNSKEELDIAARKNELSLSLIPTTPFKNLFGKPFSPITNRSLLSRTSYLKNETPTPTKYLNGFETDMFPDLHSDNPFDATFRKANSCRDPHSFSIPESSSLIASLPESEDLNTPSITLPPETPIIFRKNFPKPSLKPTLRPQDSESTDTMPFTPAESTSTEQVVQYEQSVDVNANREISTAEITSFISSATSMLESSSKVAPSKINVVQTPVITSTGNFSIAKSNSAVPTAVVVNGSKNIIRNLAPVPSIVTPSVIVSEKPTEVKIEPQAVVQSVCVTPMVQLMIRLPDGKTMPVNIPMAQMPQPASIVPVQKTIIQVPAAEPEVTVSSSIAKTKLKEMVKMNQKASSSGKVVTTVKSKARPIIQPVTQEVFLSEFTDSPPSSPVPIQKSTGRKRSHSFDTSPDEKQKRSRERNRAAATRCREKRKLWITGLEQKAEELETKNSHLQVEVNQLRNEVAQLKTMLLAHKDCPVTQQQRGMVYEAPKDSYTTIQIVPSTSEDLQRVPNCTISSPLNPAEYIEVDLGSVQSSDASFTSSDASETSFKER